MSFKNTEGQSPCVFGKPSFHINTKEPSHCVLGTIKNPIIVITSPPVPAFVLPERVPNSDANDPPMLSARDINNKVTGLYSLSLYSLK